MYQKYNDYTFSDDKSLLSLESIKKLLEQSYWASDRTMDMIKKSIDNSICYGVYKNKEQIGFGRVITDYSTMFWICDIIIHHKHRNQGLGKILVKCISQNEELSGLLGVLATKDAHGLYEQYGFNKESNKFMMKLRTK